MNEPAELKFNAETQRTPRTDELVLSHIKNESAHDDWLFRLNAMIHFAQQLERELNEAKKETLNAFKAGMTEAAEIACANPCDGLCFCPACKANKAILSARDKKGIGL